MVKRSYVWDHFEKTSDKKYVKCNICNSTLRFCGNTTNLITHLKRVHPSSIVDLMLPSEHITDVKQRYHTEKLKIAYITPHSPTSKRKSQRESRSIVWDHFEKSEDNKYVQCNICKKELKFCGNTTNLTTHLKRFHPLSILNADREMNVMLLPNATKKFNPSTLKRKIRTHSSTSKQKKSRSSSKRSIVWVYFKKTADGKLVQCKICKKEIKFFGNTTNLMAHLKRPRHPMHDTDSDLENMGTNSFNSSTHSDAEDLDDVPVSPVHLPSPVKKHHRQLYLKSNSASKLSNAEVKDIDDTLLEMILVDLQPLSIVENSGFLKYSKMLQPLYTPPCKEMLTTQSLPAIYNEACDKLKNMLSHLDYVSVTTDLWTTISNKLFMTATAHFILDSKKYASVLATRELLESPSGENIASALMNIFEEFNIDDKIVAIVSDNSSNVRNAATEYLKKRHVSCVGQTLNSIVIDSIKENHGFSAILAKCRNIVFFLNNDAVASQSLTDTQQEMELPILNVTQDDPTVWSSALRMMEELVLLKTPLSAVVADLPGAPLILDSLDWDTINDCILILKPLDEMTNILSSENYPSLSMLIPLARGIRHVLNVIKPTTDEALLLQASLVGSISKRLGIFDQNKLAAKATFLDPRFKKAGFGNEITADVTEQWVMQELTFKIICAETENRENALALNDEMPEASAKTTIWTLFDSQIAERKALTTPTMTSASLLQQYLEIPHIERTKNPLEFWTNYISTLRELYSMHLKYLCVPAISVPSEIIFSKTGNVNNERRKGLSLKYMNEIIFLNSAFKNDLL